MGFVFLSQNVSSFALNVNVRFIAEILIIVSFIVLALGTGALWWGSESELGQFCLLLLQALLAPFDATILEPHFDLRIKKINS